MNTIPRREAQKILVCVVPLVALLVITGNAGNLSSARTAPGAPANVTAVALRDAAIVAWLLPASSDGDPPTSYTISAFDSESPRAVVARVKATAPGVTVHGLNSERCYIFRVRASNAAGNGPESEPSEPTCPLPPPEADIALTMTAPDSSNAGAELTFTMTVTNNGLGDAAMVSLSDSLPAPLSSFTTTQGACAGVPGGSTFNCNLGALDSGSSATVTVTVLMGQTDITNTVSVKGLDAAGTPLTDPVPGNNTATVTIRAAKD